MNYNRHRLRQQIIDQLIKQAQDQRSLSIQSGRDDPFQVYYYPTPLDDPFEIEKLQEKIKGKLVQQANIAKMTQIKQQLNKQLYIINEQIATEKYQSQAIDMMIQQLQNKLKKQKIKKQVQNQTNVSRKQVKNSSMQTQKPALKDSSSECGQSDQTKMQQKLKKNHIFSTQIYSITIKSQHPQNTSIHSDIKQKKVQRVIKKQQKNKQLNKNNTNNQNKDKDKEMKVIASANPKIQQIYQDLQKQMRYMQHLKRNKHKKQYKQQKQKVKFIIQLFWKYAQNQKSEASDMSLPIFQL